MSLNVRMFPPGSGKQATISVNGRSYTCPLNATVDVPQVDAVILSANGWTMAADAVGTTAQRLASNPFQGMKWHDTTLNLTVVHEGTAWRNPATGAVV
jgi:hypothetical protein